MTNTVPLRPITAGSRPAAIRSVVLSRYYRIGIGRDYIPALASAYHSKQQFCPAQAKPVAGYDGYGGNGDYGHVDEYSRGGQNQGAEGKGEIDILRSQTPYDAQ